MCVSLQDWVGKHEIGETSRLWWNWEVDRVAYPDWEEMVAELAAQGIRVMAYVNPHLSDVTHKAGHRRNLFREARDRGFLVRRCDGFDARLDSFGLLAGMVDLSNPEAYAWMKEVVRCEFRVYTPLVFSTHAPHEWLLQLTHDSSICCGRRGMLQAGVSGWMADFGEALPMDACMHDGTTGATWHNKYPAVWAALNQEVIAEAVRAPHEGVYIYVPSTNVARSWPVAAILVTTAVAAENLSESITSFLGLVTSQSQGVKAAAPFYASSRPNCFPVACNSLLASGGGISGGAGAEEEGETLNLQQTRQQRRYAIDTETSFVFWKFQRRRW